VVVLPGSTSLFLASPASLPHDPSTVSKRLEQRAITSRVVNAPYVRYLYSNDRTAELRAGLAETRAWPNSDRRPICYQLTALAWLAKFIPPLGRTDPAGVEHWVRSAAPELAAGCAAACLVAGLIFRRRALGRRLALVFVTGLAGMAIETVLLLGYQTSRGILFQDVGLLLTSFMAGLAAGALGVDRLSQMGVTGRTRRRLTAVAMTGVAAASVVAAGTTAWPGWLMLSLTATVLAIVGLLVGAIFALAGVPDAEATPEPVHSGTRPGGRGPGSSAPPPIPAGPLYAADLAGGALGALLGGLILVPAIGMPATSLLIAALVILALTVI
jgi:spermidine synthase